MKPHRPEVRIIYEWIGLWLVCFRNGIPTRCWHAEDPDNPLIGHYGD